MSVSADKVLITVDPQLFRKQALLSSGACFLVSLLYFATDFPRGYEIGAMSLVASVLYLLFYVFFYPLYKRGHTRVGMLFSGVAILTLAFVVHFSGGVTSPFVFLYFILLISEAVYGLQNPVSLPLAVLTYGFVCAGEAFNWLTPANSWAVAIYSNKIVTVILVTMTVTFMWITRYITGLIVLNLRVSLDTENAEKQSLLAKFTELNSSAQIGVLSHRIVHDLRGPIASISGYIQLEMLKSKTPEDRGMLKDVNDIVTGMSESLKGITQFGRAAYGPPEKIVLSDLMRMIIAIVSFSPQARGVKFIKLYEENFPAAVYASRADLQQVYFNIIKNAVEAVKDNAGDRRIEFSVKVLDKEAEISITDNGPGMAAEVLKGLFRRSMTTKKDGTGVGLLITRDLLFRNDGSIEFHNLPAGGLWVVTRFPLARS